MSFANLWIMGYDLSRIVRQWCRSILVLLPLLAALSAHGLEAVLMKTNDWVTAAPLDEFLGAGEETRIRTSNVFPVSQTNVLKTIGMLQYEACIEVSEDEALSLVERPIQKEPGYKTFLVRGVCQNREVGHFDCHFSNDLLWVAFSTLGTRDFPQEKQPIIIVLKKQPRKVFVTSSIKE